MTDVMGLRTGEIMNRMEHSLSSLREMDMLAAENSPVHQLHPSAKLVTTIAYIIITVSFSKYQLNGLLLMIVYPAFLFSLSGVSVGTCFRKLRFILPLVLAVGLFNPIFDRTTLLKIGNISVSGGTISMITLMLKGVFCLAASFLLMATTSIDSLCAALRQFRLPSLLVSLLLLTYRYIGVMTEELAVMTDAYSLRAPGQNGIRFNAWGSFLGQLILRTMDRADELYSSMQLRGFTGSFTYADCKRFDLRDAMWILIWVLLLLIFRFFDVPGIIGALLLGG